ncbi:MAG: hypothetical protein CL866_04620 [Cycloclasticus sp.]|nr:hypothetical protein [Cycloclasticus sp.]MBG96140.1 hypothetical protein [Cycloclasticus sp.]|tara:strand:+ start:1131 stop:1355 length:225 start_codon:yes stop_codon:yes gene_type:complete
MFLFTHGSQMKKLGCTTKEELQLAKDFIGVERRHQKLMLSTLQTARERFDNMLQLIEKEKEKVIQGLSAKKFKL